MTSGTGERLAIVDWTVGQLSALVKKVGGTERAKGILRDDVGVLITSLVPKHAVKGTLEELEAVKKEITTDLDEYKLHLAAERIYHYMWHAVADGIIEETKKGLVSPETLKKIFLECLALLHPFMPFVTEEIYQYFPKEVRGTDSLLMIRPW